MDSAWYYLRYLDPKNDKAAFNRTRLEKWLPQEKGDATRLYTGGAEHAVLHLLYVRFVAMALCDWGFIVSEEPFKKFCAHGLLIREGAKMSKSKGNVVNPDEYISNFGADTLRMYLMFLAPFEEGGDFRDSSILGIERFLKRVWAYATEDLGGEKSRARAGADAGVVTSIKMPLLHKTVKKVSDDIAALHYNTAVSALMILLHALEEAKEETQDAQEKFEIFLKLLAPFAPHITEEIWREVLGHMTSVHRGPWPQYDPALIVEETVMLIIQVNGKVRDAISADPSSLTEETAKALALQSKKVQNALGGKAPQKVIYVDKKLVNLVL